MIAVDKNIPIPAKSYDGRNKYPFHTMEVGDSFALATAEGEDIAALAKRMRTSMGAAGRRLGRKFVLDREGAGVRIWRAA